jgi:hypothetical protein
MAVTEALSLMYAWWAYPIGRARDLAAGVPRLSKPFTGGRLSSWIFATHGIAPLGYAAFAFALGTAAGALPFGGKGLPPPNAGACMARRGIREDITYQPARRYWAFQWIETGIFLALALALSGFCFRQLGRRRT